MDPALAGWVALPDVSWVADFSTSLDWSSAEEARTVCTEMDCSFLFYSPPNKWTTVSAFGNRNIVPYAQEPASCMYVRGRESPPPLPPLAPPPSPPSPPAPSSPITGMDLSPTSSS